MPRQKLVFKEQIDKIFGYIYDYNEYENSNFIEFEIHGGVLTFQNLSYLSTLLKTTIINIRPIDSGCCGYEGCYCSNEGKVFIYCSDVKF